MKNKIFKNILKYLALTLCLFVSAFNFNLFMKPVNFVTGGTPGLAIIVEYFFKIPTNYFIYIVYIVMFVVSLIFLGKKSLFGILFATICYPFFVTITADLVKYITIDYNDFFLICLFSGIISGIANGFIYKMGFASSGLGVLGPVFNKCFHVSISSCNFAINTIIVLIGGYFFGIEMVLYAIIFLYLNSFISNRIILGNSNNKAIFINSEKINEINKLLYDNYNLESIIIDVQGGYTKEDKKMFLVVVPSYKYNLIIENIKLIDKNVFYNVLDSYELKN